MIIPVTKPYLPPIAKYEALIREVWQRNVITNNGPLVQKLEQELKSFLNLKNLLYVSNGTIALQLAIKALGLKGEIITTPFSYVATTSSIVWEGCVPVFVDIDPNTLNIDAAAIEDSITSKTTGILATHCYGNACDIEAIQEVAARRNMPVIYDAAHAFGTRYKGRSIFEYGDISTVSFHATKLFHTIEGGAVISRSPGLIKRLAFMRNFGHDGPERFNGVGINGKNSEFHAAMGLCLLDDIDVILRKRREQAAYYDSLLESLPVRRPVLQRGCDFNHAYYPIIFESEVQSMNAKMKLEENQIFPRRYFYPPLSSLGYVASSPTPVSDHVAGRILCLPVYHDLTKQQQEIICNILLDASR